MFWHDFLENPQGLKNLYDDIPVLNGVKFHELILNNRRFIILRFDLPRFPDHPPKRWDKRCNALQIELSLSSIRESDIVIKKWMDENIADITLELKTNAKHKFSFSAQGDFCIFCINADFIYLNKFIEYAK